MKILPNIQNLIQQLEKLKNQMNLDDQTDGIIETSKLEGFFEMIGTKKNPEEL